MECPACGDALGVFKAAAVDECEEEARFVIGMRAACGHIMCDKCMDALVSGECGCMFCGKPIEPTCEITSFDAGGDAAPTLLSDNALVRNAHSCAQLDAQAAFFARQTTRLHAQAARLREHFATKTTSSIEALQASSHQFVPERVFEKTERALLVRIAEVAAVRANLMQMLKGEVAVDAAVLATVIPDTELPVHFLSDSGAKFARASVELHTQTCQPLRYVKTRTLRGPKPCLFFLAIYYIFIVQHRANNYGTLN